MPRRPSMDARSAIAHARATGSVAATYNGAKAQRLYTHDGGICVTPTPTNLWLVTEIDGATIVIEESP